MEENKKIIIALKKAQTHLGHVIKMVDDGEYCVDVMQQNLAVMGLLRSANDTLMKRHLGSCFMHAMRGTNEERKEQMIEEIVKLNKMAK